MISFRKSKHLMKITIQMKTINLKKTAFRKLQRYSRNLILHLKDGLKYTSRNF